MNEVLGKRKEDRFAITSVVARSLKLEWHTERDILQRYDKRDLNEDTTRQKTATGHDTKLHSKAYTIGHGKTDLIEFSTSPSPHTKPL